MKIIKRMYNAVFSPANALDLAKDEIEKSRKAFLTNKTHFEYYASQVDFEAKRIKRLEEYINDIEPQSKAKAK
jgi:predicted  nucleic acid-binding Zn-ribbon protein